MLYSLIPSSNSTHKHKAISHIHAKLHTDVKNLKHCSSVSFACSESNGVQEFVIVLACISRGENRAVAIISKGGGGGRNV